MIGLAMEKWPSDALRRVLDAPVEDWKHFGIGSAFLAPGRCLLMHAADTHLSFDCRGMFDNGTRVSLRFDHACPRFGIPRVVRAIKVRALRILEQRGEVERTEPARVQVGACV